MVKALLYVIDTYAWVEYLIGSQTGKKVRDIIHKDENEIITPECCLAELKGWCLREGKNFEDAYTILRANSEIEGIGAEDWLEAAAIRHEIRKEKGIADFGLIDSLIVVKQRKNKCKVVSGDKHFKGLKDVEYVGP